MLALTSIPQHHHTNNKPPIFEPLNQLINQLIKVPQARDPVASRVPEALQGVRGPRKR